MDRDKLDDLIAWKVNPLRKPLILRGARQVGKTWLIKEFGRTQYKQCVYTDLCSDADCSGRHINRFR